MLQSLKKLFSGAPKADPLAEQRTRLREVSIRDTVESARHPHMHHCDINVLLLELDPNHKTGHIGIMKRKKDAPVLQSWLRAEPNPYPERTPMLYRLFLMSSPDGQHSRAASAVMVSNGVLKREDVMKLFEMWNAEAARIAALPPEPEEKKEEAQDITLPAPPPPAP